MHLYDYLCREARAITDGAPRGLTSADEWLRTRSERVARYRNLLALPEEKTPLNPVVTGGFEREGYRVENLYFESLPQLYVAGNLYIPTSESPSPRPAVLYLCGHSSEQKVHYQAHARRFAQLGFVCLIIDTIQYGEVFGEHCGTYARGYWNWYSRGYTSAGVETWNAVRALDYLESLDFVDGARMGSTGISGGGSISYWLGAVDERLRCVAAACCTGTIGAHVAERTIQGHCDCVLYQNPLLWDWVDITALIAPRPLLIASADRDILFSIASIHEHYERLRKVYELLGAGECVDLVTIPGKHAYGPASRTAIFDWFLKHLAGKTLAPEAIGDIDESADEPADTLRVFVQGPLRDDRSTTIQDTFVPLAKAPEIRSRRDLEDERERVRAALWEESFAAFPENPPEPGMDVEMEFDTGLMRGFNFQFRTEGDWMARGTCAIGSQIEKPKRVVVTLMADAAPQYTVGLFREFPEDWMRINLEPRGTRLSGFSPDLAWLIRRCAAITGRTLASMRIWDALRLLDLIRSWPRTKGLPIALAGSGEMAVVAVYAALLDGHVDAVVLHDPPATQDVAGDPEGHSAHLELLHCLRHTDVALAAALLHPADLVFLNNRPETWRHAEEVYARLGGRVWHIRSLNEWAHSPLISTPGATE